MRSSGIKPSATVLVATVRALIYQGADKNEDSSENVELLKRGLSHLGKHIENPKKFNVPVVVAINRFHDDTDEELAVIEDYCRENSVECAVADVFGKGGEGAIDLAKKVIAVAEKSDSDAARSLYDSNLSLELKIEIAAKEIYGAEAIYFETAARKKLRKFTAAGFGKLPVCIAKTQSSLSDKAALRGVPKNWTLTVSDAHLSAGAGFVVVTAGTILLMPGLPENSQAMRMDVDNDGNIAGLS